MQGIVMGISLATIGLGNYVGSLYVTIVNSITQSSGKQACETIWLHDANPNMGRILSTLLWNHEETTGCPNIMLTPFDSDFL